MEPLARAVSQDDHEAAACWIARFVDPDAQPRVIAAALDEAAIPLRVALGQRSGLARARGLLRALHREGGLHAPERYLDPDLSHLGRVLERRVGSPVALAVLLASLGRRVDVPITPVAFPGHFLVRLGDPQTGPLCDPCTGAFPIQEAPLSALLSGELGFEPRAIEAALAPASAHAVAVRLLQNLQRVYERTDPSRSRRLDAELTRLGAQGASARRMLSLLVRSQGDRLARGAPRRRLTVHPEGRSFRVDDRTAVDLSRRRALPRLLTRLARHHIGGANHGLGWPALVEAGWPGEVILADAAWSRLRTSIRTLRKLGLEGVLITIGSGYLLDPECDVRFG